MNIEEQSLKLKEAIKNSLIKYNLSNSNLSEYPDQGLLKLCGLSEKDFKILFNDEHYVIISNSVSDFSESVVYIGVVDDNDVNATILKDFKTTGLFIASNIYFISMDMKSLEKLFMNPLNLMKFIKQFKIGSEDAYKRGTITKEEYDEATKLIGSILG